ncbi:hypothetical protein [Streptomyces sp. NPDC001536]|uniref:hypothetical protein n=1 Tax=Streptomyces sp. NPDC001536 TaxID=3364583 RepID=UPI0036C95B93
MKSPHSINRHRLLAAVVAAVVAFTVLFTLSQLGDDLPSCPTSRTGSVDIVPSGVRPCVLNGPAAAVAPGIDTGSGHTSTSTGSSSGKKPNTSSGTAKQPKTPTAPKAPVVPKAPAAPAQKAPPLTKTR